MKIRAGLIGCGKVAHIHARALSDITDIQFVAVHSRSEIKGRKFAKKYSVKSYTDIACMVRENDLNMVVVCTPHPNHAGSAIPALQAGAHVLVEKPLATSLEDCDQMISTAKKAHVKLGVVSQRRFFRPVQRIREAIDSGKIGEPVLGIVTLLGYRDKQYYRSDPWRGTWHGEGGGILVNQAPHQLDLLLWFMGEIDELYGCWANLNHPYIEVEDTALAVIRFKSGALGNIIVSNSQNPALYGRVSVFGKNGATVSVQTDGGAMFIAGMSQIEEPPLNDVWTISGEEDMLNSWRLEDEKFFKTIDPIQYYHQLQLQDFMNAIVQDRDPLITAEQGRRTVELITAIYQSQRENKIIRFPFKP